MKKTKKKIGKCSLCGIPVTKADMIVQKGEQKPKVVVIVNRDEEMLACLAHPGVAEIFEMQEQIQQHDQHAKRMQEKRMQESLRLEDKRLKQRYGKLFSGPVADPSSGSLKR